MGRKCKVVRRLGRGGSMHQDSPSTRDSMPTTTRVGGKREISQRTDTRGDKKKGWEPAPASSDERGQQVAATACPRAQELHGASYQAGGGSRHKQPQQRQTGRRKAAARGAVRTQGKKVHTRRVGWKRGAGPTGSSRRAADSSEKPSRTCAGRSRAAREDRQQERHATERGGAATTTAGTPQPGAHALPAPPWVRPPACRCHSPARYPQQHQAATRQECKGRRRTQGLGRRAMHAERGGGWVKGDEGVGRREVLAPRVGCTAQCNKVGEEVPKAGHRGMGTRDVQWGCRRRA